MWLDLLMARWPNPTQLGVSLSSQQARPKSISRIMATQAQYSTLMKQLRTGLQNCIRMCVYTLAPYCCLANPNSSRPCLCGANQLVKTMRRTRQDSTTADITIFPSKASIMPTLSVVKSRCCKPLLRKVGMLSCAIGIERTCSCS